MHHFTADRIISYTPKQMFDLVADIEKYPEFVPLCKEITVFSHEKKGRDLILVSSMMIKYLGRQETFTTQVQMQEDQRIIIVKHIKHLFNVLENHWHFEEIANGGCIVHFSIKYELQNRFFDKVLNKIFERAFLSFAIAFEKRAHKIYASLPLEKKISRRD
ncbi:MAG: type II toxin-antitoxin system RatA family toxin [Candidatus Liberibacter ctenarytainae]|uniref:Type II toxin-antitoxin system RatA family toxin n=1 Tax=Candidatus Liberibacter ctenarytainae TaxID=2020335 RepID=A0A937AR76_9HYPH|nr:type II toxin-antitoxin system RatA family toxin [Candidatus Liberibacter ctenarytainae]